MSAPQPLFFIALLPPPAIQDYVTGVKQIFADRYQSRAALKSPPHITLQPPFKWPPQEQPLLLQTLNEFVAPHSSVPVTLSGFGAFAPRVIYINVVKTPELLALQSALADYLEHSLNLVDPVSKTRPFAPHMTVGFRDLTKPNFRAAWAEFQPQSLQFEFLAIELTLLRHNGQRWVAEQAFPLQPSLP